MTHLTTIRLGLAAIGAIIWGYGVRTNDETLNWVGIGFLAAALLARFVRSNRPS